MTSPIKGLGAALLIFSQGAVAQSETMNKCIKPAELEADQVRYIETQLRVAALQCRDYKYAELPVLYNDFILENRPYLVRTQKPLATYVKRSENMSVDDYIIEVANRVSIESARVSQFCNRAQLAAELSAKTEHPVKLLGLLPVSYERPAASCEG